MGYTKDENPHVGGNINATCGIRSFASVCGSGTCCLGTSPETTACTSADSGSAVEGYHC